MEQLKPVKSGKVKVDDVNLYYEIYGQGDPLVFVAGTGISCAPWRVSQVPEFAKHYQVVIYDHRGLGRSDKPDMPYSTELFAKDCAGLMDTARNPASASIGPLHGREGVAVGRAEVSGKSPQSGSFRAGLGEI